MVPIDQLTDDQLEALAGPTKDEVKAYVDQTLTKFPNLPPDVAHRLVAMESGYQSNAQSSTGPYGVMQLSKAAADEMGVDRTDWKQNIEGGLGYLAKQFYRFKDPKLALAAYRDGPTFVAQHGYVPTKSDGKTTTEQYVNSILGGATQPNPTTAPDLSHLSDEELVKLAQTEPNTAGNLKAAGSGLLSGAVASTIGLPGDMREWNKTANVPTPQMPGGGNIPSPFLLAKGVDSREPGKGSDASALPETPTTARMMRFFGADYDPQNNVERYVKSGTTGLGSSIASGGRSTMVNLASTLAGLGGEAATQIWGKDGMPAENMRWLGQGAGLAVPVAEETARHLFLTARMGLGNFLGGIIRGTVGSPSRSVSLPNLEDFAKDSLVAGRAIEANQTNPPSKIEEGESAADMLGKLLQRRNERANYTRHLLDKVRGSPTGRYAEGKIR